MFTTERLILREFRPETDAADYLRLRNNVDVQRTMSADYIVPVTHKAVEKRFESFNAANFILHAVVTLKETAAFIGFTSVMQTHPRDRDGILSIALLPEYWNKGYATEAMEFVIDYCFEQLGLHRLSLGVFSHNKHAFKLYQKFNFVLETTKRQANWVDGEWEDIYTMGLLEDEWKQNKLRCKQANIKRLEGS